MRGSVRMAIDEPETRSLEQESSLVLIIMSRASNFRHCDKPKTMAASVLAAEGEAKPFRRIFQQNAPEDYV